MYFYALRIVIISAVSVTLVVTIIPNGKIIMKVVINVRDSLTNQKCAYDGCNFLFLLHASKSRTFYFVAHCYHNAYGSLEH